LGVILRLSTGQVLCVVLACAGLSLLSTGKPASAFVLTLGHVDRMLKACPAVKDETANVVQGEIFAFMKTAISSGEANL
jgi:hypothetical protein